jgi:hypothetical protein
MVTKFNSGVLDLETGSFELFGRFDLPDDVVGGFVKVEVDNDKSFNKSEKNIAAAQKCHNMGSLTGLTWQIIRIIHNVAHKLKIFSKI